jgi:hypothetical protein
MGGNFLNAFISDFRFLGIKLTDRPARRLGIEVAPRGRAPCARWDVCRGSFSSYGPAVDGLLLVGGFDGSAVSRAPLDTQG